MGVDIEMIGRSFTKLTVIKFIGYRQYKTHRDKIWLCRCSCGNETTAIGYSLRHGGKTSCGCKRKEELGARRRTHGMTNTPEYRVWSYMLTRCYYKKHKHYNNYGGRGIGVDINWRGPNGFKQFYTDMGPRPSPKHTIERVDNNLSYGPDNCIWLERRLQARNQRKTIWLEYAGQRRSVAEWAERIGIPRPTLHNRIRSGWSPEKVITTPIGVCVGRKKGR